MSRFLLAAALGVACLVAAHPSRAADPTEDEMIRALAPKPPAQLTRGLGRGAVRSSDESQLALQVQFDYNSAKLTPESVKLLERLAAAMKSSALAARHFRIEGHTDASGSAGGNVRLSGRRAESVRDFLRKAGVDDARMSAIGLGSGVLANKDDPFDAINRRVVVLSMEQAQITATGGASAASVQRLAGTLKVQRGDQTLTMQPGARLREGDVVITERGDNAVVRLDDGARLALREETRVEVGRLQLGADSSKWAQAFRLAAGAVRYVSGALTKARPQAVTFATSTATIGIRGTDLEVVHLDKAAAGADPGTYVRVNQGVVALGALDGSRVDMGPGENGYAGAPKPATRGGKREPAATRLAAPPDVFRGGVLDEFLEDRKGR